MYSCWARGRVWTTTAKSRSLAGLGMTRRARGHRAGGSEDPPLQLGTRRGTDGRRGEECGSGDRRQTQRGTVLGAIGGHGSLQKERLDFGIFGEPRGGEAQFRTERVY